MRELIEIAKEKFFVRTMTAQEMRDYAKAAAAAMRSELPLEENLFFETALAKHEDALVQQLSAELVAKGIPEPAFLPTIEDLNKLTDALQKTEDLDDPQRVVKAWCQVNPHFLSRSTARKEDLVFSRLMSRWEAIKKQAEHGEELPKQ